MSDYSAQQGVTPAYVTPLNEPDNDFGSCGQEGIVTDESSQTTRFVSELPRWISEPDTEHYVSALGHHMYNTPNDSWLGKVYETSGTVGHSPGPWDLLLPQGLTCLSQEYDPTIDNILLMSRIISKDFASAHDSGFR